MYRADAPSDTVDFADIARTLRWQWRALAVCLALGILGATVVILFAPQRFDGRATVLVRPGQSSGTSIVGRITGVGDLIGGLSSLSGSSAGFETELQVLRSRTIASQVVDSLGLQFRVRKPEGTPPGALFQSSALTGLFAPRKLRFERQQGSDAGYRADWNGKTYTFRPGVPTSLDIGTITLAGGSLPAAFEVAILDHEDAITRFASRLEATKAGGEIAKVIYRGDDSLTAAAAANAVVSAYLERRKTTDRGVNQRRVEYVTAQMDSTAAVLAATERQLRQYQEASQVIDLEQVGKVELENAATLRRALVDLQVDEGAIQQLLAQSGSGERIASRDLAAYPGFLRSSAVGPLVNQLSALEAERIKLLERRTERDPEVVTLDLTMRSVEANIVAMARSYAGAVSRQRSELEARVDSAQRTLRRLPAAGERGGRLQRDVTRLTQIFTALQAQLVEARLGAISEGGDVRQIDVALPPRTPAFPKPILTMGVGVGGGLVLGIVAAMMLSLFGRWLRDPMQIERALGVSAQRFLPDAPLMMVNAGSARTLLVVPLDARAQAASVAARLARTARQRALPATVVDLTNGRGGALTNGGPVNEGTSEVVTTLEHLERDNSMVIVQMPSLTSDDTIAALRENRPVLLVAAPGPVDRAQLANALDTLRRLRVPCAGVVITDVAGRRHALT